MKDKLPLLQTVYIPLVDDLGRSSLLNNLFQNVNMSNFLQGLFDVAIVIGALLAVARITWGGFIYMTQDSINIKKDAKQIITDAVIGLVLLISIVLILRQINPNLLKLDFIQGAQGTTITNTESKADLFDPTVFKYNNGNTTIQQLDSAPAKKCTRVYKNVCFEWEE